VETMMTRIDIPHNLKNEKLLSVITGYGESGEKLTDMASYIKETEKFDLDLMA